MSDHIPQNGSERVPEMPAQPPAYQRETVGIFDTYEALETAVDALLLAGFARCELSLAGSQTGAQASESAELLADDPAARRTGHFCTEALGDAQGSLIGGFAIVPVLGSAWVAAATGAGVLATTGLVAATGGAGALIGVAPAALIARQREQGFNHQAEHGGLLLWVGVRSAEQEARAVAILEEHAAHNVHSHYMRPLEFEI